MPFVSKANGWGVYHLQHGKDSYYRLGSGAEDARLRLSKELKAKPEDIAILDGGKKQ